LDFLAAVNEKSQLMQSHELPPLHYFLTSLAGIARALEDFGYRDEAVQLFRVKKELEEKVTPRKRE
jgi:hypothetical protein